MTFGKLAFAAVLLMSTSAAYAQNLVQNPGFETGDNTGWTRVSPRGNTGVFSSAMGQSNPHTGTFFCNFGDLNSGPGSMSQILTTVNGRQYTLDYFLGNYFQGNLASPNEFSVSVGGTVLSDLLNIPAQNYKEYTFQFVAGGPSTVLKFTGFDNPAGLFLDDVRVTGVASTPEPGSLAFFLIATLTGAGFLTYRRRKAHNTA